MTRYAVKIGDGEEDAIVESFPTKRLAGLAATVFALNLSKDEKASGLRYTIEPIEDSET